MTNFNALEFQRMQLLEKLGQVAESMRLCANVADEFARTMSGQTLTPGVNLFSDGSSGLQSAKRKAQVLDDDDEGKKKRAPRKPRDPNAPKRPPSSYLLFQNEVRAELKAKFPELPNSELLQMISRRWATMSDEDKEVYSKQNATAKEAYAAKKAIYDTANVAGRAASPAAAVTPASKQKDKKDKSSPQVPSVTKVVAAGATSSGSSSEDSASDSESSSEVVSDDDDEEEEAPPPPPKRVKKVTPAVATPKDKKQKA